LICFLFEDIHVMNGLPGDLQFVDVLQNKKISSFKVVRRHLTTKVGDINPDPLEVTHVIFFNFSFVFD